MADKWAKHFMAVAREVAKLSYCVKAQVGAVAVVDRRIICTGYNGTLPGHNNCCEELIDGQLKTTIYTQHAERNLVGFAARNGIALLGCSVYVTHAPCIECAKMLINAGVHKLWYSDPHKQNIGVDFLEKFNVRCYEFTDTV